MRSVANGSFTRLSSLESLWRAWKICRRGKRRRPTIATYDLDADRNLCHLHRRLSQGTFRPNSYRLNLVHDPKTRLIATPALDDRIVHHALLSDIGPTFERSFIDQSYACCSGRGPLRAALRALDFTRRYEWRLSLDIKSYFASIEHRILLALFTNRLNDPRTIGLLTELLSNGGAVYQTALARRVIGKTPTGQGLPLGGYLSHWSGALYLDGLDHFVKRSLKCKAYLRYMDDFVLFHDSRQFLAGAQSILKDWLWQERGLNLHARQRLGSTAEPTTYLGFRLSRAGLAPGPKMKRRLRQRLAATNFRRPERLRRTLLAYRGLMTTL